MHGHDRDSADPVGRQVECERAGQRFAAALRGVIGDHADVCRRADVGAQRDHVCAVAELTRCDLDLDRDVDVACG
jgi:hypothetical protein